MENRIVEHTPAPREESTKRVEQKMLPQQIEAKPINIETQGKTISTMNNSDQTMKEITKDKDGLQPTRQL